MSGSVAFLAALTVAIAAGCQETSDRPPVRPGGGGGGGTITRPDAGTEPDGGEVGTVSGRICPVVDLRFPTVCDGTQDPEGVRVDERVSGEFALAGATGLFTVATDGGASTVLLAGGQDLSQRDSVIPVALASGSASGVGVPIMSLVDYDLLAADLGVAEADDTASVVVYVRAGGLPLTGVEAVAPAGSAATFYDDDDGGVWDPLGETESAGAVLFYGVPVEAGQSGTTSFTLIDDTGSVSRQVDAPVVANTTTFLRVEMDP